MNRLKQKLRSRKGESLAEVLISTLIAAVALVMLASMITTSARLIRNSQEKMTAYYGKDSALAEQKPADTDPDTSTVTVTISGDAGDATVLVPGKSQTNIYYFTNGETGDRQAVSYRYKAN